MEMFSLYPIFAASVHAGEKKKCFWRKEAIGSAHKKKSKLMWCLWQRNKGSPVNFDCLSNACHADKGHGNNAKLQTQFAVINMRPRNRCDETGSTHWLSGLHTHQAKPLTKMHTHIQNVRFQVTLVKLFDIFATRIHTLSFWAKKYLFRYMCYCLGSCLFNFLIAVKCLMK